MRVGVGEFNKTDLAEPFEGDFAALFQGNAAHMQTEGNVVDHRFPGKIAYSWNTMLCRGTSVLPGSRVTSPEVGVINPPGSLEEKSIFRNRRSRR